MKAAAEGQSYNFAGSFLSLCTFDLFESHLSEYSTPVEFTCKSFDESSLVPTHSYNQKPWPVITAHRLSVHLANKRAWVQILQSVGLFSFLFISLISLFVSSEFRENMLGCAAWG